MRMDRDRLQSLLGQVLDYAKMAGAEAADVLLIGSEAQSVTAYKGKVEKINSAHSFDLGLRVFQGKKQALVSSQDLASAGLKKMAEEGVSMLKYVPEDENCGLRDGLPGELVDETALDLFDASSVDISSLTNRALACEEAANSSNDFVIAEESSAGGSNSYYGIASTSGFSHISKQSGHYSSVSVLAHQDGERQVHSDYTYQTHLKDLRSSKNLGEDVALWAQKKLKARKIASQKVPIVFDPRMGARILGYFVDAINGRSVSVEGRSFLKNKMNERVANKGITIIDDPFMSRGRGSVFIDHELVVPQKKHLVDDGVLKSWILDLRTARKMGLESTGHGFRSAKSIPSPSCTNLYLQNGSIETSDLIKSISKGLYVFDLMGYGYNVATGDVSEGAMGFWIENGEVTYPVHEITIAGNLFDIFSSMILGNDLSFNYGVNTPTMLVEGMTIAGV